MDCEEVLETTYHLLFCSYTKTVSTTKAIQKPQQANKQINIIMLVYIRYINKSTFSVIPEIRMRLVFSHLQPSIVVVKSKA